MKLKVQGGYSTEKQISDLSKGAGASDSNTIRAILSSDTVLSASLTEEATVADGGALPAKVKVAGGYDGTNVQVLKTDANGELQIDILSQPALAHGTDSVKVGDGTDFLAISAAGEASVSDATSHGSLSSIDGKLPASLGAKLSAASLSVVMASDASAPLPTGAATAAKQDTGNTSLGNIDTKTPALGQAAMAASSPVVIASDQSAIPASQSGTWNITNVSGTVSLPTGASTSAKQDTGNTSLGNIDGKLPATLGQKAMTASMAVVLASDQSAIPVTTTALDIVDFIDTTPVLDTSSTNINGSAGAFVVIVASLAAAVVKLRIDSTIGEYIGIYTGAAASEVLQCIAGPGMDAVIEVKMAAADRVTVRNMATTTISDGKLCIQFIG